ncbi:MAG: hypothetical protein Q7R47_06440 [Candidatus Diapherotrites archaeon]|nr:hypothetical protein [Candidatus Diapherotrites archaeon]
MRMTDQSIDTEHNVLIFIAAFLVVVVVLYIANPVFVTDLLEPFILFAGLHDAWSRISELIGDFWADLGLLVVALLVVYFGFVLFDRSKQK